MSQRISLILGTLFLSVSNFVYAVADSGTGAPQGTETGAALIHWLLSWWPF